MQRRSCSILEVLTSELLEQLTGLRTNWDPRLVSSRLISRFDEAQSEHHLVMRQVAFFARARDCVVAQRVSYEGSSIEVIAVSVNDDASAPLGKNVTRATVHLWGWRLRPDRSIPEDTRITHVVKVSSSVRYVSTT